MAKTNTISDALSIANRAFPRAIEDDHAAYIANIALDEMWMAYDWRETIAALPPFYLIPGIQDYGSPFYAVPLDYFGLREAYLVDTSQQPARRDPLRVIKNIRKEFMQGPPRDIGYVPDTKSFRLYPQPTSSFAGSRFLVDGTYKMVAPQVTSTTLQSTLVPWDDIYLSRFVTALRWAAALTSDAPTTDQKKQQLDMALLDMAAREGLELGDQVIAPAESLLGSRENYTGIYSGLL